MPPVLDDSATWKQYGLLSQDTGAFLFSLPYATQVTAAEITVYGYAGLALAENSTLSIVTASGEVQSHTFSGALHGLVSHTFTLNAQQLADINATAYGYYAGDHWQYIHAFSLLASAGSGVDFGVTVDAVHGAFTCDYSTLWLPDPPTSATFDADWEATGGFPMQRHWVTLEYYTFDAHPGVSTGRVCRACVLTDGSGHASFEIADNLVALTGAQLATLSAKRMATRAGQIEVISSAPCLSSTPETNTLAFSGFFMTQGLNRDPGESPRYAVGQLSAPGVFEFGSDSASIETNWRAKVRLGAWCEGRKHFLLPGVGFVATGLFGTESLTADADGDVEFVTQDPTTVYDVTFSGLPSCGSIGSNPLWESPSPYAWGILDDATDFVAAKQPNENALPSPLTCGTSYATLDGLFCASCGTLPGTRLQADTYPNGALTVAWVNASGALKVASHFAAPNFVGNSQFGWQDTVTIESANASDIGMVYQSSGVLYLSYLLSGAAKFRTNRTFGTGSVSDWTAAGTPDPAVTRHSDSGRSSEQRAYRFRALDTGAIQFGTCPELEGVTWDASVTAVASGASYPYCGGVELGNGYGLLYARDSDKVIFWTKSEDGGATWSTPANTGMTWIPVGLVEAQGNVLVGLLWDATTKKCRSCRSYDRGANWEKDTADIAALPALDVPPALAVQGHTVLAVVVTGDQPWFAGSVDLGKTWV